MKKMNVIPLFLSLFLLTSCSNQEQLVEEQAEVETNKKESEKRETEGIYLSTSEVLLSVAIIELNSLEEERAGLLERIENGSKKGENINKSRYVNQLEGELQREEVLREVIDCLTGLRAPKCPGPKPPVPCFHEDHNCFINLTEIKGMIHNEEVISIMKSTMYNSAGDKVGEGIIENGRCLRLIFNEFEPVERGNLKVSFSINDCGIETSLSVPVGR